MAIRRLIGSILGSLVYYLDKKHSRLAISNIIKALAPISHGHITSTSVFADIKKNTVSRMPEVGEKRGLVVPPAEARVIARSSFQNLGMNIVEFLLHCNSPVEVTGYENINKEKGNIFVLGHFGNWELMGRIAVSKGIRLVVVGREIKNKWINRYIRNKRVGAGIDILDKKGSFKHLLNALKIGRSVAILIDQYAGRRGIFVDFLGIPTSTTHSPVLLSLRTGCPIIPVFIIRKGRGHKIIIEPPIPVSKDMGIKENTQLMVKPLERYVRMYPEQWWWVHRRWR